MPDDPVVIRRPLRAWILLFLVWIVGLAIWAVYIAMIIWIFYRWF